MGRAAVAVMFSVLLSLPSVAAAGFSLLHSFDGTDGAEDSYGFGGSLVLSGSTLFGMTRSGGNSYGDGTIFSLDESGNNFQTLHVFGNSPNDGIDPAGGLTLSGTTLFGMTADGGTFSMTSTGTVFSIGLDGTGYNVLHTFHLGSATDGAYPLGAVTVNGTSIYGLTAWGGAGGSSPTYGGTVFSMNSDGTGFGLMHSFLAGGADGETPPGSLTLSGTKLYGMTESGTGSYTGGEIFSINPDGSGYRILHAFSGNDGGVPTGSLLIVGSMMYGTTSASGAGANGTVFAMKTDGTQFTVLHAFSSSSTDGSTPRGDLVLQGSTLYGTTRYGGSSGDGTVFSVNTDATGFTVLHSFAGGSNDGTYPWGGLTLSGSTLYGMSQGGGTYGDGTVFALTVPEPGTLVLLGLAAAGWLAYRRAKRGTGCSRR